MKEAKRMSVRQMDLMFEAVRDGRVRQARRSTPSTARDCYQYEWLIDGQTVDAAQARALSALEVRRAIHTGGYLGEIGPCETYVDVG